MTQTEGVSLCRVVDACKWPIIADTYSHDTSK